VRWNGSAASAGAEPGWSAPGSPLAEQVIAPALAAFQAECPGVALDQTTAASERLLAQMSDGSLNVAVVH
jgi:DNA-binding transcriptional LysR family regulator